MMISSNDSSGLDLYIKDLKNYPGRCALRMEVVDCPWSYGDKRYSQGGRDTHLLPGLETCNYCYQLNDDDNP
jgi:hypothetical protein